VVVLGDEYESWLAEQPADDPGLEHAPDDTAYQLYSSGTTGAPKGVEISCEGLLACISIYEEAIGLDGDAVNMVAMPLFHIGGSGMAFAAHLVGATNYIVREPLPETLVDVLAGERCSHTTLVPALMQAMLAVPGVEDRDFSALRAIAYGGAPIPESLLVQVVEKFDCEFLQAYGLTESTGTVTTLPAADHDPNGRNKHRLRAAGLPISGVEIKLVDPVTLEEVPTGEVGEVLVRGPTVMKGYWKQPELTKEAFVDGWLRSGDAGYFDEDGYLYLHDRIKDMIVSGGENIYPAEIENALASHAAVAECAVIGVPSERWGETPRALVVLKEGAEATEQELIAHCKELIASYKCPTSVEFVKELPRNAAGKVLKKELRAPYWRDRERAIG
jgi:long-chain acyl-CoA synthetase